MIILAELGETEAALLLQRPWEAVLQTRRVVVVDLCYNVEGKQVLNDVCVRRKHANQDHVDSLRAYGTQKLHDCDQEHRDASVPATSAIESEFHHVDSLLDLTLDGQVQNDGAKVAGHEDRETDLQQLVLLDVSNFAGVLLVIICILFVQDAGQA